ncbi:MAG: hypothetical protein OEW39_17070, partial [Deltaproteobacteria bacterium]|nr:hypothetical protein [Deltaproteobacteria bacterium]
GEGNSLFFAPAYRYTIAKQRNFTFEVDIATHMHNVYLQVIFELGIFGLSAYLLWLGAVLYWIRLSLLLAKDPHSFESRLLYGSAGGLGGIMIAAFFENNFFDSEVQTLMLILIGLALHAGLEIRKTLARDTPAG